MNLNLSELVGTVSCFVWFISAFLVLLPRRQDIVAATAACEEVRDSKKFAKLLELVLLVGNYLNSGTKNAQAVGFEISYLPKVSPADFVYCGDTNRRWWYQ